MSCDFDGRERTTRCQFSQQSAEFIDFICVSLSDSSSFCLILHSVSVVEHCALQEHLKEAAKEPVQSKVTSI